MNQLVLTKIAPWPTGRMMAVLYLALGVIIAPFMFLASLFAPQGTEGDRVFGVLMSFVFPFLYGVIGLIAGVVMSLLYNVVAGMVGGIPLTFQSPVTETQAAQRPAPPPSAPRPQTFGE